MFKKVLRAALSNIAGDFRPQPSQESFNKGASSLIKPTYRNIREFDYHMHGTDHVRTMASGYISQSSKSLIVHEGKL